MTPPELLTWAQTLQAVAQNGLAYDKTSDYDRERYELVRRVAAERVASNGDVERVDSLFAEQVGHATPKLDVRGVVFRGDGILLVRERVDDAWTLPGGWADVGESPSDATTREVLEESGYRTRAVKLLALYDRAKHAHPPHPWHTWKVFFLCELLDEAPAELGTETTEAAFFRPDALPELSLSRVTPQQIARFVDHRAHPEWPADFD